METLVSHATVVRNRLVGAATEGLTFLQGEDVTDDHGSDSTEKSLMIIAAIAIGALVTTGVTLFIQGKILLFK